MKRIFEMLEGLGIAPDEEGRQRLEREMEESYQSREEYDRLWEELEQMRRETDERNFESALDETIAQAGGRSGRAIRAMLDLEGLRGSEHREQDIRDAVEKLKDSDGYLFESAVRNPGFAAGTGTAPTEGEADGVVAAFARMNPGMKLGL